MEASTRDSLKCDPNISQFMLDDLQLAAELGKTLLERNKELEIILREHRNKGEELEREILHLNKHINAMTEVNDSRLKVYEQLEVGIQDLERSNQRLNVEKSRDKKQIKSLSSNIETLEARCEELGQLLNDSRQSLNMERRKNDQLKQERNTNSHNADVNDFYFCKQRPCDELHSSSVPHLLPDLNATTTDHFGFEQRNIVNSTGLCEVSIPNDNTAMSVLSTIENLKGTVVKGEDNEELTKLISDLECELACKNRDYLTVKQRNGELEEQLVVISK